MSAYMIIEQDVVHQEIYDEYVARVPATVKKFGGRYLARGGRITSFSGDWHPQRIILIEFPTLDHIQQWLSSPEYQEIISIRLKSTNARAIAVEGLEGEVI
ncbi:MAG: DUF1330 domain-containing protein [Pseudomonadota bacterium]